MPSIGMRCVRGEVSHSDCRVCAQNPLHPCMLTPDLLEMMRPGGEPPASAHSPTRVQGCARQAVLQDQYDYYTDVAYQYPMTRGHMVHALMEQAHYPNALAVLREQRLTTTIHTAAGPVAFSGKSDLVVIKALDGDHYTAKVVDYKSKSKIGHDLTAALIDHQVQVNLYAFLVEKEMHHNYLPVVVDELEILYADMDKTRRFTSAGALFDRGKRIVGRKPAEYEVLELAPIRLVKGLVAWGERYLRPRIEMRETGHATLPGVLGEDEAWKCRRCPVFSICDRLAIANSETRPG